jgi:DNA repair photolyase
MLSLGPLSPKKYCTFSCPFCYVGGDFLTYASMTTDDILGWVEQVQDPFDIVYVSCDTDSFAAPRQAAAIDLLERLAALGVDLLFTTRALLSDETIDRLAAVASRLRDIDRMLIACISLAQLTVPHLEPKPIPPPDSRIAQLARLRAVGLRTVLALRPFLPNVPLTDYVELVNRSVSGAEVVLGGVWYYDAAGTLEGAVLRDADQRRELPHVSRAMDFDTNTATWNVFEGKQVEEAVQRACEMHGLPMFMRSAPAVQWLRDSHRGDNRGSG